MFAYFIAIERKERFGAKAVTKLSKVCQLFICHAKSRCLPRVSEMTIPKGWGETFSAAGEKISGS